MVRHGFGAREAGSIAAVDQHKGTGYRILGCLDVDASRLGQSVMNGHKVIGLVRDLEGFLRKTSLDELSQLFNLLKGEMSLVGPRPPIPREVDEYSGVGSGFPYCRYCVVG